MINRRPLVHTLLADRPDDLLVVSGLGSSTWDVSSAGNAPGNFCFIGAMGQAGPFALGLALAQPKKRVLLITGEGELLMSLGVLATIANQAPKNLAIVVLDNEAYVETGGQPTATAGPTDLEAVAQGCGIATTCKVTDDADIGKLTDFAHNAMGPAFAVVKVAVESLPLAFPYSFDGAAVINRFREAATK
jgi:thiamine pyrophosphate-dependent acetolactate synthase large subunit-like protein